MLTSNASDDADYWCWLVMLTSDAGYCCWILMLTTDSDILTIWKFDNLTIVNLTVWQIDKLTNWPIRQFDLLAIWQFVKSDNLTI